MRKMVAILLMTALAVPAAWSAFEVDAIQRHTAGAQAPMTPPLMYAGIRG